MHFSIYWAKSIYPNKNTSAFRVVVLGMIFSSMLQFYDSYGHIFSYSIRKLPLQSNSMVKIVKKKT